MKTMCNLLSFFAGNAAATFFATRMDNFISSDIFLTMYNLFELHLLLGLAIFFFKYGKSLKKD